MRAIILSTCSFELTHHGTVKTLMMPSLFSQLTTPISCLTVDDRTHQKMFQLLRIKD